MKQSTVPTVSKAESVSTEISEFEEDQPVQTIKPFATTKATTAGGPKRKAKNGRKALREIKQFQTKNVDKHLIPRESIRRFIAEVVQTIDPEMRIASQAVEALRTAAEANMTQNFALAGSLANELSKKDTVDLPQFRVAANILLNEHRWSTAGLASGALMAPLG